MWLSLGTLAIAAFGGAFILHYLKNYLLKEKLKFSWDWDGVVERGLIAGLFVFYPAWLILVPLIVIIKIAGRLLWLGLTGGLAKVDEPAIAYQKVSIKEDLALDLFVSPLFAIIIGMIF
ncbi:MAG TPA: hypothetical protein VMT55_03100 [Candidatus Sulfotelmatobacter sp.]|nr:hypothetical protein [Candidatus Sulfotelmatobacter sp.]